MKLGTDPKLPNYCRPEYLAVLRDLKLISDEIGGTRTMHEASVEYIRKWTAEKPGNYKIRRMCETFFEGLGRTLSAAIGMLYAKPPEIDWNAAEEQMADHWANIDAAGTAGIVFAKRFSEAAIRDGLAVGIVDHPTVPDDVEVTSEIERTMNLRPVWSLRTRSQAISWRTDVVNNRRTLTQIVFHEPAQVDDGEYGVEQRDRFRVLRLIGSLATWTVYEMNVQGAEQFSVIGSGVFTNRTGAPADFLPIAIAYTGRSDEPMVAKIPLLGVAWANLSHWQIATDLRFNTAVAGFAQPTVIGELAKDAKGVPVPLEIGPLVSVHVQEGGDFKWSEPQGTGLERQSLLVVEKLREMAALGLSFLQRDSRAAETAEAKRLDASAENSTLATAGQGIADALNEMLSMHWWFMGGEEKGAPMLTLNAEYEDTSMQADLLTAYVRAIADAGLPPRLLVQAMQRGNLLGGDEDVDEIVLEMMANQAAIEAEREAEREARMATDGNAAA
jgi:hypothetical protein